MVRTLRGIYKWGRGEEGRKEGMNGGRKRGREGDRKGWGEKYVVAN